MTITDTLPPRGSDRDKAERLHRYIVEPGGQPMPGVTSVIKCVDSGDGLMWGAAKLTAEIAVFEDHAGEHETAHAYKAWLGGEFKRRWNEKADLGSRIHDHALAWSQGQTVDAQEDEEPYLDALQAFLEAERPEWIACERVVGNPTFGYGGRADGVGRLANYDGVTWLDWKTGDRKWSALKDALQLTLLSCAEGFVKYDDLGMVTGLSPLPRADHLLNVYLGADGEYAVYKSPANDASLLTLGLTCAHLWHLRADAVATLKQAGLEVAS